MSETDIYSKIKIIHETPDYLIVYKPYGLTVHKPNSTYPFPTLADFLVVEYPELSRVGDDPILRPGIVHRLDKDTSGLMLICRTQESFEYYKSLFKKRTIHKKYYVLVHGQIFHDQIIDKPIVRSKTDGSKFCVSVGKTASDKAKQAITEINILKVYRDYTFLSAKPKTGRTHQIRVHLQSISRIVAGDTLYKPKRSKTPNKLNRLFLHAYYLKFKDSNGEKQEFKIGLPKDLYTFLTKLQEK